MICLDDEESKFADLLGLDKSQAVQIKEIPRSLRKVLFDRFTKDDDNESHRIKQLEGEIKSLREKLAHKSAQSELNSSGSQQQGTIEMGYSSFSTQDIDVS